MDFNEKARSSLTNDEVVAMVYKEKAFSVAIEKRRQEQPAILEERYMRSVCTVFRLLNDFYGTKLPTGNLWN